MGRLLGWSVTFLHLPGASGETSFTPLFDIVKHTTTEGSPALFTGSHPMALGSVYSLCQSWRLDQLAKDAKPSRA